MEKSKLLLSAMRSLWGILTPNVRKVSIDKNENLLTLHFYYNKNPSETEVELSEEAASELIANFSDLFLVNSERLVVEFPNKIEFNGDLIYSRFEL